MELINLPDGLRFDTRGLPEGYDPHKLYEYRFQKLYSTATGLEMFLYRYIPYSIIRSFAFAIDPTAAFKVGPGVITPVNRKKYSQMASVLQNRTYTVTRYQVSQATPVNYGGVGGCSGPQLTGDPPSVSQYGGFLSNQDPLPNTLEDTTSRTRLMGSSQGELKMFKAQIFSPSRTVSSFSKTTSRYNGPPFLPGDNCARVGGSPNSASTGFEKYTTSVSSGGRLSLYNYTALKDAELSHARGLCQKHAISMIKGYSPFNRDYTLFRNLAELRDLPGSVLSLKETIQHYRALYVSLSTSPSLRKIIFDLKAAAKDIPNEWLSFHFGWKQTYKDVMDLLATPQKISKRYNFLMKTAGKPTTFRSKRNFSSAESDVSGFEYETLGQEYSNVVKSRIEREEEVRLIVNATFDFPPIEIPYFQFNDYLDRIGIKPRVTDVYNLVPWTWLVDWFTGLGNYVECIDNLNHDPALINWGMLVCVTKGKLITTQNSKSFNTDRTYSNDAPVVVNDFEVSNNHTSQLEYTCEVRMDAATVLDVKTTSDPSSLTAYQKSIIGALLAQRTDFSRTHTFRVRS